MQKVKIAFFLKETNRNVGGSLLRAGLESGNAAMERCGLGAVSVGSQESFRHAFSYGRNLSASGRQVEKSVGFKSFLGNNLLSPVSLFI